MKRFLFLAVALVSGLVLGGCFPGTGGVGLGEEFTLSTGESAAIKGEDLEITFLEVLEDSRCPKNVTCIWEGRATSLVQVSINGDSENLELIEPGLTYQPTSQTYKNYRISFYLLPYPEEGRQVTPADYRLVLTVSELTEQ